MEGFQQVIRQRFELGLDLADGDALEVFAKGLPVFGSLPDGLEGVDEQLGLAAFVLGLAAGVVGPKLDEGGAGGDDGPEAVGVFVPQDPRFEEFLEGDFVFGLSVAVGDGPAGGVFEAHLDLAGLDQKFDADGEFGGPVFNPFRPEWN